MKRILHIVCNIGLVFIHILGIMLIEASCMSLIVDHHKYYSPYLVVVPLIAGIMVFHHLLVRYVVNHGTLYSTTINALIIQDTLALLAVSIFLFLPNRILGTPMFFEYTFIICVHILMIWARSVSVNYIRKSAKK